MNTATAATETATNLAALAADINAAHAECEQSSRATVVHALDAGRLLIAAKAALPHGEWLPWLRANVECSERAAQLYMQLARDHPDPQSVADLTLRALAGWAAAPGAAERDHEPDEWFSPPEIVEPARALMGAIDLDPASCPEAQAVVKADHYFTAEDDGLVRPWHGRCWCNPPYSLVEAFAHKLIDEHDAGAVTAAVLLVNASTDAGWFSDLAGRYPLLLTRGRVRFWRPDRGGESPRFGQALFGVGVDAEAFASAFAAMTYAPNITMGD